MKQTKRIKKNGTVEQKDELKSLTKAAGVKSILVKNNQIIMTSFGKGAKAVIEKKIIDGQVTDVNTPPIFNVEISDFNLNVKGVNSVDARPENPFPKNKSIRKIRREIQEETNSETKLPVKRNVGMDQIFAKEKLENQFFGKIFNDNIKIQIIYNILDIDKILAPAINEVLFSVNNLYRDHDVKSYDISDLKYTIQYKKDTTKQYLLFEEYYTNAKPYFGYFPNVFMNVIEGKNRDDIKGTLKTEKEIYDILKVVSGLRQSLVHDRDRGFVFKENQLDDNIKETLNAFYCKKINDVNKNFEKLNVHLNFSVLDVLFDKNDHQNKNYIYQQFYDFHIRGESKNLGFSIKKIREEFFKLPEYFEFLDKSHDSHRQKINTFIDFLIYMYYDREGKNEVDEFISNLRKSITEGDKQQVYEFQAIKVSKILCSKILDKLLPLMSDKALNKIVEKSKKKESNINNISKINTEATYFTKIMYFLSMFLDGKSINDLLSTIINKLDNIAAFIELEKMNGESVDFKDEYTIFKESLKISEELRFVKAVSRMNFQVVLKEAMYLDAAYILGFDSSGDLKIDKENILNQLKIYDKSSNKDNGFRNFIINNVIKSRDFVYLMRHVSPKNAKGILENHQLTAFVLNRLPETQIKRYFDSINNTHKSQTIAEMINYLTKKLAELKFLDFKDVNNKEKADNGSSDKEKKMALIGLYLRVLYRIYRNMILVNSRYMIAFHVLERDYKLIFGDETKDFDELLTQKRLATTFIDKMYLKPRQILILNNNLKQLSNKRVFKEYRNQIVHLNSIRNLDSNVKGLSDFSSYFAIYHYVNQKQLINKKLQDDLLNKMQMHCSKGRYSKDSLHVLHSPFGYNQARYKNLSIEDLFDRNKDSIVEE